MLYRGETWRQEEAVGWRSDRDADEGGQGKSRTSPESSFEDSRASRVVSPNDDEVSGSETRQDTGSETKEGDALESQRVVEDDSESQHNWPHIRPRFADIGSLSQQATRCWEIQVREKFDLMCTLS